MRPAGLAYPVPFHFNLLLSLLFFSILASLQVRWYAHHAKWPKKFTMRPEKTRTTEMPTLPGRACCLLFSMLSSSGAVWPACWAHSSDMDAADRLLEMQPADLQLAVDAHAFDKGLPQMQNAEKEYDWRV